MILSSASKCILEDLAILDNALHFFDQRIAHTHYYPISSCFANSHAEFDLRTISEGSSAAVRYANNSNYRNDSLSAYLRISLSLIMRFTSSTSASLTHTITPSARVL
jgi:hypothetical protein